MGSCVPKQETDFIMRRALLLLLLLLLQWSRFEAHSCDTSWQMDPDIRGAR